MKIELNSSTNKFSAEVRQMVLNTMTLRNNIKAVSKLKVTKELEKELIKCYKQHGIALNSLLYDERELLDNPFYKDIDLTGIKKETVKCVNRVLPAKTLLEMGYVKYVDGLLDGYIDIGYFNKDVTIPVLHEGDTLWMSPTIAEQRSMKDDIDKAHGNVLTFGLGIGYYAYMCLLKEDVESVTVVELNKDIIDLFKEHILPQFKTDKQINIVHGNMYDYYNEEFMSHYDYIFVDVWEDNEAGFEHYKKLMQTGIKKDNIGYWIEDSIIEPVVFTMTVYFNCLIEGNYTETLLSMSGDTREDMKMVHRYFRDIKNTVRTKEELMDLLNSKEVVRGILSK